MADEAGDKSAAKVMAFTPSETKILLSMIQRMEGEFKVTAIPNVPTNFRQPDKIPVRRRRRRDRLRSKGQQDRQDPLVTDQEEDHKRRHHARWRNRQEQS